MTRYDPDADTVTDSSSSGGGEPIRGRVVERGEADADAIINSINSRRHPDTDEILDDDARHVRSMKVHQPDALKLPGFGEPEADCGEYTPATMRFCVKSGRTHEFKHNCLRYDCPQHAPYAVRRRAAGSSSMPGLAPTLKALISRLYGARGRKQHFYHHLFVSIPDDFFFTSTDPLEKGKEICREIMDELGIQGVLVYHPFRGPDEDEHGDDRGYWRDVIGHRSNWSNIRDELEFSPHFHIIGVAPHVDVGVTDRVEDETGWVIHRRQDDNGRSIYARDDVTYPDDLSETERTDLAMSHALTYALSHAGIYSTAEQRRLAAWLKGPDLPSTEVYPNTKRELAEKVHVAAEDTLGIASPSLECDCDYHKQVAEAEAAEIEVVDSLYTESGAVTMRTDLEPSVDGWPYPDAPDGRLELGKQRDRTDLPRKSGSSTVAGGGGSSTSDLSSSSSVPTDPGDRSVNETQDGEDVEEYPECGGRLEHISRASDFILDPAWREHAPYADEIDRAYRDFVSYMTNKDVEPLDDLPTLDEDAAIRRMIPRLPEETTEPAITAKHPGGTDDPDPPIPPD